MDFAPGKVRFSVFAWFFSFWGGSLSRDLGSLMDLRRVVEFSLAFFSFFFFYCVHGSDDLLDWKLEDSAHF